VALITFQKVTYSDSKVQIHRPISDYKDGDRPNNYLALENKGKQTPGTSVYGFVRGSMPKQSYVSCPSDQVPTVIGAAVGKVSEIRMTPKIQILKLQTQDGMVDVVTGLNLSPKQGDLLLVVGECQFQEYGGKLTAKFAFPSINWLYAEYKGSRPAPTAEKASPRPRIFPEDDLQETLVPF
jgi:hypothetical protein